MIKAVVFDYGNVISAPQKDYYQEMEDLSGIPASLFKNIYSEFRHDFDRGLISGVEMYRRFFLQLGYEKAAENQELLKKIIELDLKSWRAVNEEVIEWGLSLKKAGFKLGILSNMPTEFLNRYGQEIRLFQEADYATFSCNVNCIKPEKAIYFDLLKGLSLDAAEIVFFDDLKPNIEAAIQLGFKAFLWENVAKAKKDFHALLSSE